MFSPDSVISGLPDWNAYHSQPDASSVTRMVRTGLNSRKSPGRRGGSLTGPWSSSATPSSVAVFSLPGGGAVKRQMVAEISITSAMTTPFCQVRMVCENPMTPVIGMSEGGMLAALAWSWAAEEVMPRVKPQPRPR